MNNQTKTPLYQAIMDHVKKRPISYHVPGHKNGVIFEQNTTFFQPLLQMDVTELTGLDDLHSPEGPILEAEDLLASLYNVKKSFFLINGSTVGNLAMIMAVCNEDDLVIVQRNCHKSVLNALKLAKARPIFIQPEYDGKWKVVAGVNPETVKKALDLYPEAKAVILTYPNYYGIVYDLQAIIQEAHDHQIPVLVDEAHGAHFSIGSPFPSSAVELGADIVVQSAHKTLPAMTMGSFLHFNSEWVNLDKVEDYLHTFQSSSPSYAIMTSLDIARHYLANYTKEDTEYLLSKISLFKEKLREIPGIRLMDHQSGQGDPLKIAIQSQCNLTGFELQKRLESVGIYTELADPYNVLLILPLLKESQSYPFEETAEKIREKLKGLTTAQLGREEYTLTGGQITELAIPYKEMLRYDEQKIPILEAAEQVCAETIIPYPPGIPLLLRGERITHEKINNLKKLIETGARFQQGASLEEGLIQVFGGFKE
jgi:arginine/lysine/ornithine decarboxylase